LLAHPLEMGFLSVCTALYDYQAQAEGELEIREGELLYILEKGDDDWWRAKKRAAEDEDEPVGLVPHIYVSEVSLQRLPKSSSTNALLDL
jgi:hypothetical protein